MKPVLLLTCLFLAGCSTPLTATSPPTPPAVDVEITPALRPLAGALHTCALAHPEIALFLDETPASSLDPARLGFRLGETPGGDGFAAPVGREQIVVIVHEANPLSQLPSRILRRLFSGEIRSWDELGGSSRAIQVWIYPPGDDARQAFDAAVLAGLQASSGALLAPDPQAMREAVSADPGAIGYLPRAWLDETSPGQEVRAVELEPELAATLRLPVLALSASRPQGAAYTLLACLQGETGRRAVKDNYEPWE